MKNKLAYLFPFVLMACSGACSGNGYPPPPDPPQPQPEVDASSDADADEDATYPYSNAYYKFVLPSHFWKQNNPMNNSTDVYFSSSADGGSAFIGSRQEFIGTNDQFLLLYIRSAKEDGMVVMGQSKSLEINGKKFSSVLLNKQNSLFWIWITVHKGYGYAFGCKTQDMPEDKSAALCAPIAMSVELL